MLAAGKRVWGEGGGEGRNAGQAPRGSVAALFGTDGLAGAGLLAHRAAACKSSGPRESPRDWRPALLEPTEGVQKDSGACLLPTV